MHGNATIPTEKEHDEHFSPCCEQCGNKLDSEDIEAEREHEDSLCPSCRSVRHELDLEEGWLVYLASIKPHAVKVVEEIENGLAGWKCVRAALTFERDSKDRRSVATAKDFHFLAPGHKAAVVFGLEGVSLQNVNRFHHEPDWRVVFSFETPVTIILAAAVAAVTSS
jgi:hypothetical protein